MRLPITLDLHIPNFNYPGVGPDQVFDKIVEIAQTAEGSGFSSVSLMDHLHQIPPVGPAQNYMFEGSTMLAAIATKTERVTLGLLVGSVTYRNPALAAKITTTLDIISGGRAWHGLGAGWFEDEHIAYGYDFPPLKVRFEMLEDALNIARAMFTQERPSYNGKHFHVEQPYNNPRPLRGDIPILIGGSGERKTLRLVARFGDGCNLFAADPQRATHLLGVLEQHCEDVGRDFAEITKTVMGRIVVGRTQEEAEAKVRSLIDAGMSQEAAAMIIAGDVDTIGQRAQALAEVGIEGMTISLPLVHDPEQLELAGKAIAPVFTGAASR
jgi:F420-dependent oxidoreductase-like protein